MEAWLADVRADVVASAPELMGLFDTYCAEALFGRRLVAGDLDGLAPGARVLEVGAGSMLLSCQLVREGYQVTALEPTGSGFSHFDRMRQLVMARAQRLACAPQVLDMGVESMVMTAQFDYAFSINVMEHVELVDQALLSVGRSLRPGAQYRFTCPNYLFPYEPHFNLPTFFSKRLTERVLRKRIEGCTRMPDPRGTWRSLNWINVVQIRRAVRELPWLRVDFNRSLLIATLERIVSDEAFAARRSRLVRVLLGILVRTRLHRLLGLLPALVQPIIDCRLTRCAGAGEPCPR